jgi:hypothetical protein
MLVAALAGSTTPAAAAVPPGAGDAERSLPPQAGGPAGTLPPQAGGPGRPSDDTSTSTAPSSTTTTTTTTATSEPATSSTTTTTTSEPSTTTTTEPATSTTTSAPSPVYVVTVRFEASSFGGGPNRRGCAPGAPICSLSGSLTVRYDVSRLTALELVMFSVSAYPTLDPTNMRVSIAVSGGSAYVNLASITPAPYFTLRFELDAQKPRVGTQTPASASYRDGAEIYQSRDGGALITSVAVE